MANSASARKRARQNEVRRQHNASLRSRMRTYIKKVLRAVEAKDKKAAEESLKEAMPVIDNMAGKGIIHKNNAARKKSRLNKKVKEMA